MKKGKTSFNHEIIPVISALLLYCIIFSTLISCQEPRKNVQSGTSDISESSLSENTTVSDISSTVLEIEKTPAEKMAAGEVYVDGAKDWRNDLFPLAEWYCENIPNKNESFSVDKFITLDTVCSFGDYELINAIYRLNSTDSSSENLKYLYILLGMEQKNKKQFILVDGLITDSVVPYPIEKSWDKIRNHAILGKYFNDFPKPICTEGMSELDISSLIGKNRFVHNSISVGKNEIAVISSDIRYINFNDTRYSDWKIDFIDITTGKCTVKSHKLKEIEGKNLYYPNCSLKGDSILINFSARTPGSDVYNVAEYEVKIDTEENDKDILKIYTSEEWEKKESLTNITLKSESGKYSTVYKNYDLYLHNNTTGKDKLLYKAYVSDENEGLGNRYASVAFFVGDTVYFNILGYESIIGTGSYNPATNKLNLYKNGIYAELYSNGYIYGSSSIFDDFSYKRFNIKTPDSAELLLGLSNSNITYSDDGKYIIFTKMIDQESDEKFISTVTIYNSSDFKVVKTYTLTSPFIYLSDQVISGDYIYLPVQKNILGNKAYIIKFND